MNNRHIKIYNMIFPIWGMLLFPPLWIITIPFNFVIDSVVLIIALYRLNISNKFTIYQNYILKIVFFGYLADVIGAVLIILILQLEQVFPVLDLLHYKPMNNPITAIIMMMVVIITGYLIYFFNKKFIFNKADISNEQQHSICLAMAVFTAPYVFMLSLDFLNNFIPIY